MKHHACTCRLSMNDTDQAGADDHMPAAHRDFNSFMLSAHEVVTFFEQRTQTNDGATTAVGVRVHRALLDATRLYSSKAN